MKLGVLTVLFGQKSFKEIYSKKRKGFQWIR